MTWTPSGPVKYPHFSSIMAVGAALLLLSLAFCPRLSAQTASSGVVLGTVTDTSGAVIPQVEVDLTNVATGISAKQATNSSGQFLFPEVAPGTYRITFKKGGFRTASMQNAIIQVNKSFTANMQMQLGEVSQTVEVQATAQVELQTTDAQIGDVVSGGELEHMPTLQRNALELRQLQPSVTPGGGDTGGTVSGARSDQSTITLDGIDISDSITGGQGAPALETQPANIENIQEFRTGVANSNVTFTRSAGGDTALISRSGTNSFHGDVYWYHQNSALNANTWDLNSVGQPRLKFHDNRGGVSVGGPLIKNKTFFYSNYEIHRLPQVFNEIATVPTATLKAGTLQFFDASGSPNPISYPLATSTLCGASNTSFCDPRQLGISPTISALWALMPPGNTTKVGDGLNTTGFQYAVSDPTKDDDVSFRLDHSFSDNLHFMGRYFYGRDLEPLPQFDIRNGKPKALGSVPDRNDGAYGGLDYVLSPDMTNSFRFGWIRSRADVIGNSGSASAALLNLPGTGTSIPGLKVALQPSTSFLNTPIDNGQISRTQLLNGVSREIVDNFFWNKNTHALTAGADIRFLPFLLSHTDTNVATTSPTALLDSNGQTGSLTIPASDTPPTCGGGVVSNCLNPLDVPRWDSLYVGALGIVNNINVSGVRDGSLNALPIGTNINSDTTQRAYTFYVQDTWRMRPSLTLTYGLGYGWQTPAHERNGLVSLLANFDAGNTLISAHSYISNRLSMANSGTVYNPNLSYLPIRQSGRSSLYNTDYGDWAPRISAAWNPTFDNGLLGRLFGGRKTVLRGGFGISYDRTNIVTQILPSLLGVGFSNTFTVPQPLCNASGAPGTNCPGSPVAGSDPGLNSFRVGQDGTTLPLPAVSSITSPIVLPPFGDVDSIGVDPTSYKVGRNYMVDFSIQREVPGNMIVETGYIGRLGRNLPSALDLDGAPYMFKDTASGQTFAQAFDSVACVVRGEGGQTIRGFTCPSTVQKQQFFENQMPGLAPALVSAGILPASFSGDSSTQIIAALEGSNLISGNDFVTFLDMDSLYRPVLGLPSYSNLQLFIANILETGTGVSNYNAFFFTLHKRPSHGLQFSLNYTLSKSLDQQGQIENQVARLATPFNPNLQYGPSLFDHPNVFNATYDYELPFGTGGRFGTSSGALNKVIGGWYTAGVFSVSSGSPAIAFQGANYGTALSTGENTVSGLGTVGDIQTAPLSISVHRTSSGVNIFSNPAQAATSFRVPLLSVDGRTGEANPLYGLGFWNFDMRIGKVTSITEGIKAEFSLDAFNLFNNVNFQTPALDLTNPAVFGVVSSTQTLTNHATSARYLQLGLRVEF